MQQFGASMFRMVVHWHKSGEVENECILHNFIFLAVNMPKIIEASEKVMTKTILTVFFLRHGVKANF